MLDAYLENCVVYADMDGNGVLSGEPFNVSTFNDGWSLRLSTAAEGRAPLRIVPSPTSTYETDRIAVSPKDDCHDATSFLKLYVELAAPAQSTVISALTTLLLTMQGQNYTDADFMIKEAFGIPMTFRLGAVDPIKALYVDMDKEAEPLMRAEQQVMAAVVQMTAYLSKRPADFPSMSRFVWAAIGQAIGDYINQQANRRASVRRLMDLGDAAAAKFAEGEGAGATLLARRYLQQSGGFDISSPSTLGTVLNNTVGLLSAAANSSSGSTVPEPNPDAVNNAATRDAALGAMSNMQSVISATVAVGNLTDVAAASLIAQNNVTQLLRQVTDPNANVTLFKEATTAPQLSRAVDATVVTGPTIPSSVSGTPESGQYPPPPPGGDNVNNGNTGGDSSWISDNMAGFIVIVVVVPIVLVLACGTGYFVFKRRRRNAFDVQIPEGGSRASAEAPPARSTPDTPGARGSAEAGGALPVGTGRDFSTPPPPSPSGGMVTQYNVLYDVPIAASAMASPREPGDDEGRGAAGSGAAAAQPQVAQAQAQEARTAEPPTRTGAASEAASPAMRQQQSLLTEFDWKRSGSHATNSERLAGGAGGMQLPLPPTVSVGRAHMSPGIEDMTWQGMDSSAATTPRVGSAVGFSPLPSAHRGGGGPFGGGAGRTAAAAATASLPPTAPLTAAGAAPPPGGAGFLAMATRSSRLPGPSLEATYSKRAPPDAAPELRLDAEAGASPEPGSPQSQEHTNPLFEPRPSKAYLNPLHASPARVSEGGGLQRQATDG